MHACFDGQREVLADVLYSTFLMSDAKNKPPVISAGERKVDVHAYGADFIYIVDCEWFTSRFVRL
jgi:hypothetical protein